MDYKIIGVASVATLVVGILGYSIFTSKKSNKSPNKALDRDLLVRILEQLKYQILSVSLEKAPQFKMVHEQGSLKNRGEEQIQGAVQKLSFEIYKKKEAYVLEKYDVAKQDFELALSKTYVSDKAIQTYNEEIQDMLLKLSNGKIPSLDVPPQIKKVLTLERTFTLHKNLQKLLFEKLVNAYKEHLAANPEFNLRNREDVIQLVRKINLFKHKVDYVAQQVPELKDMDYSTFLKLSEQYKRDSALFKDKLEQLDVIYSEFFDPEREDIVMADYQKRFDAVTLNNVQKEDALKNSQRFEIPVAKSSDTFATVVSEEIKEKVETQQLPKEEKVEEEEKPAEQVSLQLAEEVIDLIEPIVQIEKNVEPVVEKVVEKDQVETQPVEDVTISHVEPVEVVEPVVEPVVEQVVAPVIEQQVVEPVVEQVVEQILEQVVEQVVEPVVEKTVEPIVESVVEPVVETVEPVVEPVVQPVAEPVVEPVVEPVSINESINQSAEQIRESISESVAETISHSEPVYDQKPEQIKVSQTEDPKVPQTPVETEQQNKDQPQVPVEQPVPVPEQEQEPTPSEKIETQSQTTVGTTAETAQQPESEKVMTTQEDQPEVKEEKKGRRRNKKGR